MTDIALLEKARLARKMAYAPYSSFYVGAAVLAESGKVYTGANMENASYPAGTCAERNAIGHAVSEGERKILAVAVAGGPKDQESSYTPPCGICRQVMAEFGGPDMRVILEGDEGIPRVFTLSEILPQAFLL